MTLKYIRYLLLGGVILFGLITFLLSAQNAVSSTNLSDQLLVRLGLVDWKDIERYTVRYGIWMAIIRQLAHLMLYVVGTLPVYLFIYTFSEKLTKTAMLTIIAVSTYAFTDELHQLFVAGRSFQLIDLVTDITGVILTTVAVTAIIWISNTIHTARASKV